MLALDWILLVVLLASLVLGAWRGLVYEVISVIGWVAAFLVAQWQAPTVASLLPMGGASDWLRYAAAFGLLFVLVMFACGLVAWLVKKVIEKVGLRPVDRVLGALFGLLRGVLMLLALAIVVGMTPLGDHPEWTQSSGARMLESTLAGLRPVLPAGFGRFLPA